MLSNNGRSVSEEIFNYEYEERIDNTGQDFYDNKEAYYFMLEVLFGSIFGCLPVFIVIAWLIKLQIEVSSLNEKITELEELTTANNFELSKELQRLKQNESYQNKIDWSVRRELAKTNYRIHTDSIKANFSL